MCRIASRSFLQRQKGSMSDDERDFNNMETRVFIKIFFPARQGAKGNSRHSDRNIMGTCTIIWHRQKRLNWMAQFKRGDFPTCDVPCPGRLKTVTTSEIINQIHELILEDSRILTKSVTEQLGISRGQVGSIIHEDLDMRKLSVKWVPKCLNAVQKRQRCQSYEQLLEFFSARSKWYPVAIGDHGRNLVKSLWPGDKARINGVEA